jgi:hypothetical protein
LFEIKVEVKRNVNSTRLILSTHDVSIKTEKHHLTERGFIVNANRSLAKIKIILSGAVAPALSLEEILTGLQVYNTCG